MIDSIKKRRAVRDFLDQTVPEQKIQEIIKAAAFAPSANAIYPWELVIVKDDALKEQLSKTTPWATFAKSADLIIAVIGDEEESPEWLEDCSIVAEHIWLEAVNQGLDSCWIQIRRQGDAENDVRKILNIPKEKRVLCLLPIGVAAENLPEHDEAIIEKNKIKYETYK
jgi:nitroreductase